MIATSVLLKSIFGSFLLPPGIFILLFGCAFALRHRAPKWSPRLFWLGLTALYALSSPFLANLLINHVETSVQRADAGNTATAIVVLGGGKRFGAIDMLEGEAINNVTLARLRYAARLQKFTQLPLLVSGGAPTGGISEAQLMQESLQNDFGVAVRWLESNSNDTADNASESAKILLPQHHEIILVTSADHMARAKRSFIQAGFKVNAAPSDFSNTEALSALSFFPNGLTLQRSGSAIRELLGQAWYANTAK